MTRLVTLFFLLFATHISAQSVQWLTACTGQSFCLSPSNCTQGNVLMTAAAVTSCNTSQEMSYTYKIDLQGNGSIDIQADGDTVSGTFAKGIHRITWRATDMCGNALTCSYSFTVKDCTPPNMLCLSSVSKTLNVPDCQTTFTARQFILNSSDNCTPSNGIQFAIREQNTGTGFPTDTSVTFGICSQGLHTLEVWGKDVNGLTSQCNTYVLIQDGSPACACITDANVMASGCVRTAAMTRLPDYQVRLKVESVGGTGGQITKNTVKNTVDSCFSLTGLKLPLTRTYRATISAERFENALNGVTTFDLVQMSKHILGITSLTDLYQGIAADVNNSQTITGADIVQARKLILGIYDSFPGVPSWRLVRPVLNPTDFSAFSAVKDTYQIIIPALAGDVTLPATPFIAVKTGDVNFSALPFGGEAESRGGPLSLQIADLHLAAGEETVVPIRLAEAATLSGWQLALGTDPMAIQITDVQGLAEEDYLRSADGSLRALWFDGQEQHFAAGTIVFTLKIKALRPVWLSQALRLNPSELPAEAYTGNVARHPLVLEFGTKSAEAITFFPPQPNPFAAETTFQYRLEQPGEAVLEIFDAAGRLVYAQTVSAAAGLNSISLPAAALRGAGVYAFRLRAGGHMYSGRLVRM